MQKDSIRVCALAFDVGKEIAAKLSLLRSAHHRRVGDLCSLSQRQLTLHPRRSVRAVNLAFRQRMLETKINISGNDRRTFYGSDNFCPWGIEIDQMNFGDGQIYSRINRN